MAEHKISSVLKTKRRRERLPKNEWVTFDIDDVSERTISEIFKMYKTSYKEAGLTVKTVKRLKEKYKIVALVDVDKDPYPDAFIIYLMTKYGSKIALIGSDGSLKAKDELKRKTIELLNIKGWYLEASGGLAISLHNRGVFPIDDEHVVSKVLSEKGITWIGNGKYKRYFENVGYRVKELYGRPIV